MLLSVPTALLAVAPDLATFTALRITQGVFMATAFTLMLSYLGEACTAQETAGAFAAYITGNVASNLFGRLLSAALADHLGLAGNFYVFAALNLAGAVLVYFYLKGTSAMPILGIAGRSPLQRVGRAFEQARRCARASSSAFASCSRSSARSPTSISCWCASRWR